MKTLKLKLVGWLLKSLGYTYVAVYYRAYKNEKGVPQYEIGLEGDQALMNYTDVAGYVLNKKPLVRKKETETTNG